MGATALFEAGKVAARQFLLRASAELALGHGTRAATQIAIGVGSEFHTGQWRCWSQ